MASPEDLAAIADAGVSNAQFIGIENEFHWYLNDFIGFGIGGGFDRINLIEQEFVALSSQAEGDSFWLFASDLTLGDIASLADAVVAWPVYGDVTLDHLTGEIEALRGWAVFSDVTLDDTASSTGAEATWHLHSDIILADLASIAEASAAWHILVDTTLAHLDSEASAVVEIEIVSEVEFEPLFPEAFLSEGSNARSHVTLGPLVPTGLVEVGSESASTVTLEPMASHARLHIRKLEPLPAWPFEADWSDDCVETLEWLTDILRSPIGAEQRRGLRLFPRQTFEFKVVAKGVERSLFDNLLMTHGAKDWYLPLWHSVHQVEQDVAEGIEFLPCATALLEFGPGEVAYIGTDPFNYELIEVGSVTAEGLVLDIPLARSWPAGTRFHPARIARFTEQPKARRETSDLITCPVRFKTSRRYEGADVNPLELYRSFPVLTMPPDESERLEYGYDRILEEMDNQTGIPFRHDSAGTAFANQSYRWVMEGREELTSFRSLMFSLRGRLSPLWVPTFFDDFFLAAPVDAWDDMLTVRDVGFTKAGGPRTSRRDIVIELFDGQRLYRRINESILAADGTERLSLDAPLPFAFDTTAVARISFLALARLDHDNIEISHRTDTAGMSIAKATFRNAPELRIVQSGF